MASTIKAAVTTLFAVGIALSAFAQSTPTVSRAEGKAETRAVERAGKLVPPGEGAEPIVPTTSQKTREQRKAETLAARREGLLIPAIWLSKTVLIVRIGRRPRQSIAKPASQKRVLPRRTVP